MWELNVLTDIEDVLSLNSIDIDIAQQEYYEETMGLTPEERAVYWVNVRADLARKVEQRRKPKQSRASSQPQPTLQPAGAIAI